MVNIPVAHSVTPGQATVWLQSGWRIFAASPGAWIVTILLLTVISIVVSLVPLLGTLLGALLTPFYSAFMFLLAHENSVGRTITMNKLIQPLRKLEPKEGGVFQALMILGLLGLAVAFAIAMVMLLGLLLGGELGGVLGAVTEADDEMVVAMLVGGLSLVFIPFLLIGSLLGAIWSMLCFYAIPLVTFSNIPVWPALKASGQAFMRNIVPWLLFGLILLGLGIVASIPLFLGWLVLLPVMVGAGYASFVDIFQYTPAESEGTLDLFKPLD